jgi:hypothetical protein
MRDKEETYWNWDDRSGQGVSDKLTMRRFKIMKKLVALLVVILPMVSFGSAAIAEARAARASAPAVIGDVLVLRPLGFAGTVIGTGAFVVSLPVTLSFHRAHQAKKLLVKEPFHYTFERPLGKTGGR